MAQHHHHHHHHDHDHRPAPRTMERRCDVVVVGATVADLALAAELARRGRAVIVLDGNGASPDGLAPDVAAARDVVRRHGGEVLAALSCGTSTCDDGRVQVALTGGHTVVARVVVTDAAGDATGAARAGAIDEHLGADTGRAGRSANEDDWEHRYAGAPLWSGNPNGSLVIEVGDLAPGRALDVGAGEGGDAVWLAEQGWTVTANDISQHALDRLAAEATRRGLAVECRRADANEPGALGSGFDLVSAQYASIPRTPDDRAVRNLLAAVAPGGTLLVVGHDLAPMRAPVDVARHSRVFDPDAYVRVEDVAAALAVEPGWEIEVHETRPRPPGAASASHHVDDVVLRARRR